MNYLYGFVSATVVYCGLSFIFPARETLLSDTIHDDRDVIYGVSGFEEGAQKSLEGPFDDVKRGAAVESNLV